MHPDAEPQRTEVTEHDLALRRLAEEAHVGDTAVGDEVARARCVTSVLPPDRVAVLGLLDLTAHRRDHHVPREPDPRVLQCVHGLDVAGEGALHVRDAESVEPATVHEVLRLEAGHVAEPVLLPGVRGVHVAVEHQRLAAPGPAPDPECVGTAVLDLLPLDLQPERPVEVDHQLGHPLLVAREAPHVDHPARRLDEAVAVDGDGRVRHLSPGSAGAPSRRRGGSARAGSRPRARA